MTDERHPAIEIDDVAVAFGDVKALDGLSMTVPAGTVFGLLGPNGAGKTTIVRVLATLLLPDRGTARVAGRDVVAEPLSVRRSIGLAGQFAAVDEELTGRENLEMIGALYRLPRPEARRRASAILDRFDLADAADRRVGTYSGGMRRRLDLAASLTGRPPVLLLDEPSTGLDPRSRQELWAIVDELRSAGTSVLLTTQYLDEADRLAQRIAVVDHGRIAASGTSDELKATVGSEVLVVRVADAAAGADARSALADLAATDAPQPEAGEAEIRFAVTRPDASAEAVRRLDARGIRIAAVELHQPSLDDVFLSLTGRPATEEPAATKEAA